MSSLAEQAYQEHVENLTEQVMKTRPGITKLQALGVVMSEIEKEKQYRRDLETLARYSPETVKHIDGRDTYKRRMQS